MLFLQFDRLLLLERRGYTCYFGSIGPDGAVLREYLARNGVHCPPNANVAEYLLDAIGVGVAPRIGDCELKVQLPDSGYWRRLAVASAKDLNTGDNMWDSGSEHTKNTGV